MALLKPRPEDPTRGQWTLPAPRPLRFRGRRGGRIPAPISALPGESKRFHRIIRKIQLLFQRKRNYYIYLSINIEK